MALMEGDRFTASYGREEGEVHRAELYIKDVAATQTETAKRMIELTGEA